MSTPATPPPAPPAPPASQTTASGATTIRWIIDLGQPAGRPATKRLAH